MIIDVKNITKSFDKNVIIDDVSITFSSGNIYGLIGRNGSGKSVFLKMLCGFYKPDKGNISYDTIDIVESNLFAPNTGALIEKPSFIPDLTGFENLKLLARINNKIDDDDILKVLKLVELYEDKDKKYNKYSLGMKQKLGIAQAIMEDPQVIILDEPLNGIENKTAEKVRNILKEEKKKGKLIIIATHIKDDVENLADFVYEFADGKIRG